MGGGPRYSDISAGRTAVSYGSVAWGDYDSDGDPDILLTGNDGLNAVSKIYRNNGDGTVDQTVNAAGSTSVSHAFASAGSVTIGATASDKNGGKSAQVAKAVSVAAAAKGKIASAKLSKKKFTAAQAKKVKLTVTFSPPSKKFSYLLTIKKDGKWLKVRSVNRTGNFSKRTMTVKSLFGGKAMKPGSYRLKLSADANSKTVSFKII